MALTVNSVAGASKFGGLKKWQSSLSFSARAAAIRARFHKIAMSNIKQITNKKNQSWRGHTAYGDQLVWVVRHEYGGTATNGNLEAALAPLVCLASRLGLVQPIRNRTIGVARIFGTEMDRRHHQRFGAAVGLSQDEILEALPILL